MSRARIGIAEILSAFWAGTRNATKFREPTSGQARRMRQDLRRLWLRLCGLENQKARMSRRTGLPRDVERKFGFGGGLASEGRQVVCPERIRSARA
jgi:hypothetical protein